MCEANRKVLQAAVAGILLESEFESVQLTALETLTEIICSFLVHVGHQSRCFAELAGRTEAIFADVLMALINMGIKLDDVIKYSRRFGRIVLPNPQLTNQPKQLGILSAGVKQPHPSYIPAHLPPFPDPHAYIRTPTHKQPVTEYEAIREKAAQQKKDTFRALNKIISNTRETDNLFTSKDNLFPLIATKQDARPYLTALLPKDQVFDYDEIDDTSDSPKAKKLKETTKEKEGISSNELNNDVIKDGEDTSSIKCHEAIDNPYLRCVKIPPPKIKIKDLLCSPLQNNIVANN